MGSYSAEQVTSDAGAVFPGLSREAGLGVSAWSLECPGFVRGREIAQGFQVFSLLLEVWVEATVSIAKSRGSLGAQPICSPWPSQDVPSDLWGQDRASVL